MYAEKLLANADRGLNKFEKSRDLTDLAMMIDCWDEMQKEALEKVYKAYGGHVIDMFHKTFALIQDKDYLLSCLRSAHMNEGMADRITEVLRAQLRVFGHAGSADDNPSNKFCTHRFQNLHKALRAAHTR